ncbi:MAG: phosphotransferase [Planctomycetes bacterium]|nr:phosphotransferase [Planctomycetota bacterium]
MTSLPAADLAQIDALWHTFVASGEVAAGWQRVQGRLVRAVHRGVLPSGPVHVKTMAFPRAKDRLRYLVRALPAAHEARMLRAVAAAGIPCPEVLDVRTLRRRGLPFRSMLVLRTMPLAEPGHPADADPWQRLRAEAELAMALLRAGIVHRDLHTGNFVRLADGRLAVLDLQSASLRAPGPPGRRLALAAAARLLRDRTGLDLEPACAVLVAVGLLADGSDAAGLERRLRAERAHFERTRVCRCLCTSTEFTVATGLAGRTFQRRGDLGPGRWVRGDRTFFHAWLGQRALHLATGRTPLFPAMFRKWWWLGGGVALYVPAPCSDARIEPEVRAASAGWTRRYQGTQQA